MAQVAALVARAAALEAKLGLPPTGAKAKANPPGLVYISTGRSRAFQSQFGELTVATYTIVLHNSPAFKRVLTQ